MTNTLLEQVSPHGNVQAVVEADQNVCYFYLFGAEETHIGMKSVWVRNFCKAPAVLDVEGMNSGAPPMNPSPNCRHTKGQAYLKKDQLRVVWLPEGTGAALLENDDILAIIPPWSGTNGFHGYARDSVGQGQLAWELTADNVLHQRFAEAQRYWRAWENETFWPASQCRLIGAIETTFGVHSNYYAIDGGEWPPKAILRIPMRDSVILVTIGVSLRLQPNVEMYTERPELLRRIELAACLPHDWTDAAIKQFASYLSAQSNLPWSQYTWLGSSHTVPCDSWRNSTFTAALLLTSNPHGPDLDLGEIDGDPVNVLWLLPISEKERQRAMDHGSAEIITSIPPDRWRLA